MGIKNAKGSQADLSYNVLKVVRHANGLKLKPAGVTTEARQRTTGDVFRSFSGAQVRVLYALHADTSEHGVLSVVVLQPTQPSAQPAEIEILVYARQKIGLKTVAETFAAGVGEEQRCPQPEDYTVDNTTCKVYTVVADSTNRLVLDAQGTPFRDERDREVLIEYHQTNRGVSYGNGIILQNRPHTVVYAVRRIVDGARQQSVSVLMLRPTNSDMVHLVLVSCGKPDLVALAQALDCSVPNLRSRVDLENWIRGAKFHDVLVGDSPFACEDVTALLARGDWNADRLTQAREAVLAAWGGDPVQGTPNLWVKDQETFQRVMSSVRKRLQLAWILYHVADPDLFRYLNDDSVLCTGPGSYLQLARPLWQQLPLLFFARSVATWEALVKTDYLFVTLALATMAGQDPALGETEAYQKAYDQDKRLEQSKWVVPPTDQKTIAQPDEEGILDDHYGYKIPGWQKNSSA